MLPTFLFILPVLESKTSFLHRLSTCEATHTEAIDCMQEFPPWETQVTVSTAPNLWGQQLGNRLVSLDVARELDKTGSWRERRPLLNSCSEKGSCGVWRLAPVALQWHCLQCSAMPWMSCQGHSQKATLRTAPGVLCPWNQAPGTPRRCHSWGKDPWPLGKSEVLGRQILFQTRSHECRGLTMMYLGLCLEC